jgi:pentatricopeptide repeat protein
LAELRDTARKAGDFKKADELRKQMEDAGWRVQDTASGSQLERFK